MKKYIAIVTIKAITPIKVGSSKIDFIVDMPINRDWNNLPFIQGTSIAGMLRSEFENDEANEIFGFEEDKNKDGQASSVIFSNALLVDENEKVNEELILDLENRKFLKLFENLPIREHNALNHKGVTKEHAKFDEEIIFKGTKFRFLVESDNKEHFEKVLNMLKKENLRIGGSVTRGFGEFEIESIKYEEMDEERYIEFVPSLNSALKNEFKPKCDKKDFIKYVLKLKPLNFFMFGSGMADEYADMTPLIEDEIDYDKKKLIKKAVIPGSSVKGAISSRVAYYFNQNKGNYADNLDIELKDKEENEAIKALFGKKKNENQGERGNVYISDLFLSFKDKIFEHVKIDRFTGGAIEGALFQERAITSNEFELVVYVKDNDDTKKYLELLEKALIDITKGTLPLGGASTKGHGIFEGVLFKEGEKYEICD